MVLYHGSGTQVTAPHNVPNGRSIAAIVVKIPDIVNYLLTGEV